MRRIIIAALLTLLPFATHAQGINNPCSIATSSVSGCTTYGTSAGTATQGNDSRITGAAQQTLPTYVPADVSGASLIITVNGAAATQIGNMIFAYANVTYPSTADTNAAKISLPLVVPNQFYAIPPALITQSGTLAFPLYAIGNRGSGNFSIFNGFTQGTVTNAMLSGQNLIFIYIYPAN